MGQRDPRGQRQGGVGQRSFDQDRATHTAVLLAQAAPITADYCSWAPLSRRRRGARRRRILRYKFEESFACSGDCLGCVCPPRFTWRHHAHSHYMARCLPGPFGPLSGLVELVGGAGQSFHQDQPRSSHCRTVRSPSGHGRARCGMRSRPASDPPRQKGRTTGRSRGHGYARAYAAARSAQSEGGKPHQYSISPSRGWGGQARSRSL